MTKFQSTMLHAAPFAVIVGFVFINPMISIALVIIWGIAISMSGVEVKNHTTGKTEVFRDPATVINAMKNQAKDITVLINSSSAIATEEVSTAIDLRNLKLEVLGTSMQEQDTLKAEAREIKKTTAATALELRKEANKAKLEAYKAAYLAK